MEHATIFRKPENDARLSAGKEEGSIKKRPVVVHAHVCIGSPNPTDPRSLINNELEDDDTIGTSDEKKQATAKSTDRKEPDGIAGATTATHPEIVHHDDPLHRPPGRGELPLPQSRGSSYLDPVSTGTAEKPASLQKENSLPSSSSITATPISESGSNPAELDQLGVSVHWLKNGFLQEVCEAGLDQTATIYQIEDLRNDAPGVIRQRGEHVTCPMDKKPKAAYVHSLGTDPDKVGPATFMLSYGWAYPIGDIVDTLVDHCISQRLDPKRTYVWMCCLCNNQHRIVENRKQGKVVPFEEFRNVFYSRVTGIGHVLAMMVPWQAPLYLTRTWCVFELFTATAATKTSTRVSIVMPPRERNDMMQAVRRGAKHAINRFFEALTKVKAQNAEASHAQDRANILELIRTSVGFHSFNVQISDQLRVWLGGAIDQCVHSIELQHAIQDSQAGSAINNAAINNAKLAGLFSNVANLFLETGEHVYALQYHKRALSIRQHIYNYQDNPKVARSYNNIARAHMQAGKYDDAMHYYLKGLAVFRAIHGESHGATAATYNEIGSVLHIKGDLEGALDYYRKVLRIRETTLGKDHPATAASHDHVGHVLESKGDCGTALEQYKEALSIRKSTLGEDHVHVISSHQNIASVLGKRGLWDEALTQSRKALAIQEAHHGEDHPRTAACLDRMGVLLLDKGDLEESALCFQRSVGIRELVLGSDSLPAATSYNHLASALAAMGDLEGALEHHCKALNLYQLYSVRCGDTAKTHWDVGSIKLKQQPSDLDGALEHLYKAKAILQPMLGKDHADTVGVYNDIERALGMLGERDGGIWC